MNFGEKIAFFAKNFKNFNLGHHYHRIGDSASIFTGMMYLGEGYILASEILCMNEFWVKNSFFAKKFKNFNLGHHFHRIGYSASIFTWMMYLCEGFILSSGNLY